MKAILALLIYFSFSFSFAQQPQVQFIKSDIKKVKLFDSFAKTKGSKIIWSSWEMGDYQKELKKLEIAAENVIKFDGLSMKHYCIKNKFQIHDETNGLVNDNHITLKGNRAIADIFINYIKENNLI